MPVLIQNRVKGYEMAIKHSSWIHKKSQDELSCWLSHNEHIVHQMLIWIITEKVILRKQL